MTHAEYIKYIQQQVHTICPYEQGTEQYLYHAGFLASVIASMIEQDSNNYYVFKRIITKNLSKRTASKTTNFK